MTKYRIVQVEDKYAVQEKVGLFAWEWINNYNYSRVSNTPSAARKLCLVDTLLEAQKILDGVVARIDKVPKLKNLKVIKEVKL